MTQKVLDERQTVFTQIRRHRTFCSLRPVSPNTMDIHGSCLDILNEIDILNDQITYSYILNMFFFSVATSVLKTADY